MKKKEFDKIFILDTNVLLHDSKSIYQFQNNLVVIPMCVLEELDHFKKGQNETARNSRQFSRNMDNLRNKGDLKKGVSLKGRGFLKVRTEENLTIKGLVDTPDNKIIATALKEKEENPRKKVIVVSKDINLRVKADILGMKAEDYSTDKVNFEEMYTGVLVHEIKIPIVKDLYSFREIDPKNIPGLPKMYPNQYLVIKFGKQKGLARYDANQNKLVSLLGAGKKGIWGIFPKNLEQTLAFDMLLNDDIKLISLVGKAGTGKAQPLYSKILTPNGWVTMQNVTKGSYVIGVDGKPKEVLAVFPQGKKEIYEVTFSDNSKTRCCKEHLWEVQNYLDRDYHRKPRILSLEEIIPNLKVKKDNRKNYSIPIVSAITFKEKEHFIDSYILGCLLGDGCFRNGISFSNAEKDILSFFKEKLKKNYKLSSKKNSYDYNLVRKEKLSGMPKQEIIRINPEDISDIRVYSSKQEILKEGYSSTLYKAIKNKKKYRGYLWKFGNVPNIYSNNQYLNEIYRLNLYNCKSDNKFIPSEYLIDSIENRISLLQGLLDTDGYISTMGSISYTTVSPKLAKDIIHLVRSLGGIATQKNRITKYTYKNKIKEGKRSYTITIKLPDYIIPFKCQRKLKRVCLHKKYFPMRYIKNVELIGEEYCQCILIDDPRHLYITDDFIVTHNTLLSVAAGLHKSLDEQIYKKIVISRPIVPMGKDLGYLPGDINEKLAPWMKPIFDNVDFLLNGHNTTGNGFSVSGKELLEQNMMEVEPLTYIRGRSIPNQYLMIDECFPYDQRIITDQGKIKIGFLNGEYVKDKNLPKALSYNEANDTFEYKKIINAVHKGQKELVEITSGNKKIKCTENHPFLTTSGWKQAKELKENDYLLVHGDDLQNSRWLNKDQLQVALGSYLGDGSLSVVSKNVYRLNIIHGDSQSNYLKFKSSIFDRKENVNYLEKNGYAEKRASKFHTLCFGLPISFKETFKLKCNREIFNFLDEKGLAIWFMDDGSILEDGSGARFHTESFDKESCEFLVKGLKNKFDLDSKVLNYSKNDKVYYYIVLSKKDYIKMCSLIAPYVHQDLSYKIKNYNELNGGSYDWNLKYLSFHVSPFTDLRYTGEIKHVFDLEVEDNHNFIACMGSSLEKNKNGFIAHNCQNLTPHEIKTIITRAGEGTKIVLTGDCHQIDNPFLDASSNGLSYIVDRFKGEKIAAHITLLKGERSELAEIASNIL